MGNRRRTRVVVRIVYRDATGKVTKPAVKGRFVATHKSRRKFFTAARIRRFMVYATLIILAIMVEISKHEGSVEVPVHEVALTMFAHILPEWSTGVIGLALYEGIAHFLGGE